MVKAPQRARAVAQSAATAVERVEEKEHREEEGDDERRAAVALCNKLESLLATLPGIKERNGEKERER